MYSLGEEQRGTQAGPGEGLVDNGVVVAEVGVSAARINAITFVIEYVTEPTAAIKVPNEGIFKMNATA